MDTPTIFKCGDYKCYRTNVESYEARWLDGKEQPPELRDLRGSQHDH